jgi:hypothetical protein
LIALVSTYWFAARHFSLNLTVDTIVAAVGGLLGFLGYMRSRRVDRDTRQEPYFRNVWRKHFSKALRDNLIQCKEWKQGVRGRLDLDIHWSNKIPACPEIPLKTLDTYNLQYDPLLRRKIMAYQKVCVRIERLSKDLNDRFWLIDPYAEANEGTLNTKKLEAEKDKDSEKIANLERQLNEIQSRKSQAAAKYFAAKYYLEGGTFIDGTEVTFRALRRLEDSPPFKRDILFYRRKLQREIQKLCATTGLLESDIDFYDYKFLLEHELEDTKRKLSQLEGEISKLTAQMRER